MTATPEFCARLKAAAAANRFAITIVDMVDDSGRKIRVITNGYWFQPV